MCNRCTVYFGLKFVNKNFCILRKGSVSACMKLTGFGTSNKFKNHWFKLFVTESQTASSFLQLLTNALHDQHQIYDFILQNKTIMAALVRNGFLNKCYLNQLQRINTMHTLTNDVGRTGKENRQYKPNCYQM